MESDNNSYGGSLGSSKGRSGSIPDNVLFVDESAHQYQQDYLVVEDHHHSQPPQHLDIALSIVDVVSSYDEQSSSNGLSPQHNQEQQSTITRDKICCQPRSDRDSRKSLSSSSMQRTKGQQPGHHDEDDVQAELPPPTNPLSNSVTTTIPSPAAPIIKHFRLVILAKVFFLIGSALFIGAAFEEYRLAANNSSLHSSVTFLSPQQPADDPDILPEGYHIQLSTSIDTYVTNEMILMLGTTFCFLQVGIIDFVRTPLDRYHFFQILAGLLGLVSAMFWETKTVLSNILYFFFVHAMAGQALMQFHSHYWTMVSPPPLPSASASASASAITPESSQSKQPQQIADKNNNNHDRHPRQQASSSTTKSIGGRIPFSASRQRQQQSHFPLASSNEDVSLEESPSGLLNRMSPEDDASNNNNTTNTIQHDDNYVQYRDSDEPSFSIENSYSLEEEEPVQMQPDIENAGDKGDTNNQEELQIQSPIQHRSRAIFKYGVGYCVADGFFIFGSAVEVVITYMAILSDPNESNNNDDDSSHAHNEGEDQAMSPWYAAVKGLNFVPGIFWLLCAIVTLITTILLHQYEEMHRQRLLLQVPGDHSSIAAQQTRLTKLNQCSPVAVVQ